MKKNKTKQKKQNKKRMFNDIKENNTMKKINKIIFKNGRIQYLSILLDLYQA
jgi:hypothetical protein